MRLLTPLLAATTLLTTSLAAPTSDAAAAADFNWHVTHWSICPGQTSYDYSFTIRGAQDGVTPSFTASCVGTQKGGLAPCNVLHHSGPTAPIVLSDVKIVRDPRNHNDSIPRLFVHSSFTDNPPLGCTFGRDGQYDARGGNCGQKKGSKFKVPSPGQAIIC